jgi:hypothetical protein
MSPRTIAYLLAAFMLALFTFGAIRAFEGVKEGRLIQDLKDQNSMLERRALDQESQVAELREELKALSERAADTAAQNQRLEKAAGDITMVRDGIDKATQQRKNLLAAARVEQSRLRAKAKGRKYEELVATNGRSYQQVEAKDALPEGLRISHAEGLATIDPKNLPANLRKEFGYDIEIPDDEPQTEEVSAPETPPPPPSQPVEPPEITTREISPEAEYLKKERLVRAEKLRAQAATLQRQAEAFDKEAASHQQQASRARAQGRITSQDAEATKDRNSAAQLRARALRAEEEAIELENQ